MTREQLDKAKEIEKKIDSLKNSMEMAKRPNEAGVFIAFPNDKQLLDEVYSLLACHVEELKKELAEL